MIPGGNSRGPLVAGRHRAPLTLALAKTATHPADFQPRHCAGKPDGSTCMHDHPGDKSRWGSFAPFLRRLGGAS